MRSRPTDSSTDAELVARTRAGDVGAFEALVRRYRGLAFGLAYHQIGRFEDAEDAVQEAMVEAYARLGPPICSRPSDAIGLALAAGAEIQVDPRVMEAAEVCGEPGTALPLQVLQGLAALKERREAGGSA